VVPTRKSKTGFDAVWKIGQKLPDVSHTVSPRGESLKVRGKLMACQAIHKSAEPQSLMVRVSAVDRDRLISSDPGTYYVTEHYMAHPAVLVRLSHIGLRDLEKLLTISWQYMFEQAPERRRR